MFGRLLWFVLASVSAAAAARADCVPPGWKDGEPVVPQPGAPCLFDDARRQQTTREADAGDAEAAMLLALHYRVDLGDRKQGLFWLRRAAGSGAPDYLFTLATWLVEDGPDEAALQEARRVAARASGRGHAGAALLAGRLYGAADKTNLAEQHLRAAARLGVPQALLELAELRKEDPVAAAAWLQVYVRKAAPNEFLRGRASNDLAARLAPMSRAERAEVRALAKRFGRDWRAEQG